MPEWMHDCDYFAEQDRERSAQGPDTSDENVKRAVRYLETWLPIGGQGMGLAAEGDVEVLMAYARKQLGIS